MSPLERRRFDHFAVELSLALDRRVPRFALWLAAEAHSGDGSALAHFCDEALDAFLQAQRLPPPTPRARERLRRAVVRFDPSRRTPEEVFGSWSRGDSDA